MRPHSNDAATSSSRPASPVCTGLGHVTWCWRWDGISHGRWVLLQSAGHHPKSVKMHTDLTLSNNSKSTSRVVQIKLKAFILGALNKLRKITAGWLSIPTDCLCASGNRISYAIPAASLAGKCCSRESFQLKIPSRKITPEENLLNAFFWPQLWCFPCCKAKSTAVKKKTQENKNSNSRCWTCICCFKIWPYIGTISLCMASES